MKAKVDTEARTFTLSAGEWTGTYPISQYEQWVRFYQGQQQRFAPYAQSYQPAVDALANIDAEIRALRSA
ncbi:hypothetical protein [Mesorhizobium amorphae]